MGYGEELVMGYGKTLVLDATQVYHLTMLVEKELGKFHEAGEEYPPLEQVLEKLQQGEWEKS